MTKSGKPVSNRRKNRKARGTTAPRGGMPLWVSPFPPLRTVNLRYVDKYVLAEGAAGAGALQKFTPSSLYDPDNTGAGHQPMFFDQLCSVTGPYLGYRALYTIAKLSFQNTVAATPCIVGWYISPDGTTPANIIDVLEKPWADHRMISGSNGLSSWTTIVKIPHAKALGITESHLRGDDYYAGAYNSSPSKNLFFNVFTIGTGVASNVYFEGDLAIKAELFSLAKEVGS
jgi:hypothetical protein